MSFNDDSDSIFNALQSITARSILTQLYEEPTVASKLAEQLDTSFQNTSYLLKKLREVGLVKVGDNWYSSKGRGMTVYAPVCEPVTIVIRDESGKNAWRQALDELN